MRCTRAASARSAVAPSRWAAAVAASPTRASAPAMNNWRRRRMRGVIMAPLILPSILAGVLSAQPAGRPDSRPIGEIEFFGYKGLDVDRVRAALPLHEGDV